MASRNLVHILFSLELKAIAMIEPYLATYDYNLPLRDAEHDPDVSARRQMLAAIGYHTALDSGYYDTQA